MQYVYLLKSETTGRYYIGQTNNLKRRFVEHNQGLSSSTKTDRPWRLCYYEAYRDKTDALVRERQLKRFAKAFQMLIRRTERSIGA